MDIAVARLKPSKFENYVQKAEVIYKEALDTSKQNESAKKKGAYFDLKKIWGDQFMDYAYLKMVINLIKSD
jgi:hypothetical protein